jgi:fused signal recognition particle receptor
MSGFFKKLFNRITGKGNETPPPAAVEEAIIPQRQAPPPVVGDAPAIVVEDVTEVVVKPTPEPPRVEARKPAPKQPELKKPEPKSKSELKKAAVKRPEPKAKPEPKRVEVKKPEPKKPEPKKVEPKKAEPKKPEPKQPKQNKPESKKPELKRTESVRPELKKSEPKAVVIEPAPVEVKAVVRPPPPPPPVVEKVPEPVVPALVVPPPALEPELAPRRGWLSRLTQGLSKSSKSITTSITAIFTKRKLDAATLEELEDVLIQADLGVAVSERIIKAVSAGRYDKEIEPEEVKRILAEEVAKVLKPVEVPFNFGSEKPFVILVVGVNGAGKTTTIGKLGSIATREGFKVMFAACDTFRAAAIEQLTIWGDRIGARTISRPTGADSSGLAFDAMQAARESGTDILLIDTAGRLQNKAYLMDELDKIVRVIKKQDETAPHAVLLVLDATTGQNAISQAEIFTKVAGVTGLIMTKLDGTARGGILVAIADKFRIPIHAVGVGETIDDLQAFDAEAFARAISGLNDT